MKLIITFIAAVLIVNVAFAIFVAAEAFAQGASDATVMARAFNELASGHPVSIVVLGGLLALVWRAWREDSLKGREYGERIANVTSEIAKSLGNHNAAIASMQAAIEDLDETIKRNGK